MKIVEIVVPGEALRLTKGQVSSQVEALLFELEVRFFEANVALNLFDSARLQGSAKSALPEVNLERRHDIMVQLARERGLPRDAQVSEELRFDANVAFKQQEWAKGKEPGDFSRRRVFIAAHAFLCAIDGFEKTLRLLAQGPNAPAALGALHRRFLEIFSSLHGAGAGMHSGMPMSRGLRGSRYGCAMASGHIAEVDISGESLEQLAGIFQATLDAFAWDGPKRHLPLL